MRWMALWFGAGLALGPGPALAHGFGERYDLPLPLAYYLVGAGAAVALSFVLISLFVRGTPGLHDYPRYNLLKVPDLGRVLESPILLWLVQLLSVALFLLVVATGLWGDDRPAKNLTPTFVWIVWWVGLGLFASALLGNLWELVNPWKVLFTWAESLYARLFPGGELILGYPYPKRLGVWPAVLLFWAFAWVENVFPSSAEPRALASLALVYSGITWWGMLLFGKGTWLRHGEAFSVVFGVLARFAPTEIRVMTGALCRTCPLDCHSNSGDCVNCYRCFALAPPGERGLFLRPYAVGLARNGLIATDVLALTLLILATVAFDGLRATPFWAEFQNLTLHLMTSLIIPALPALALQALVITDSLGLALLPLLFLGVYLLFSLLMARLASSTLGAGTLARAFVYSLVPIAVAYNIAHFFSFLAIQGQLIIPLASDPFGYGWNLLGTAGYRVNIAVVNARFVWFLSVIAIVLGHIIAVYLAHLIALRVLRDQRQALRSQYPMLGLMVLYTMTSLWIIAQPIVESR